jgi:hypothetical protein
VPQLDTRGSHDLPGRRGWRQRAANLHGENVFAVGHRVCRKCRLGWVEQPYTEPGYERCRLASSGLAALRAEHRGLDQGWLSAARCVPVHHVRMNHREEGSPSSYLIGRLRAQVSRNSRRQPPPVGEPGVDLQRSGRAVEAEPLFKRALVIDEAALGPDHPDVAVSLGNLALTFSALGRAVEAVTSSGVVYETIFA